MKARYELWVTAAEKAAMTTVLGGCPGFPMPATAAGPRPSVAVEVPSPTPSPGAAPTTSVYYADCDAVRAAGAAPIHRGQPGYGTHLDGDEDGIGCER